MVLPWSTFLRNERTEIVIKAVRHDGSALEYASQKLADREIVFEDTMVLL